MAYSLCFTGHRPKDLFGYDESSRARYTELTNDILNVLRNYYDKGYRTFISGGAQGVDQIAFWAVCYLKKEHEDVQNVLYIPCKKQDSIWRSKGMFSKQEYQLMLKKADKVHYVSESVYKGPWDLLVRNHAMVNDSDAVLAVYAREEDFREISSGSGTAECMNYAFNAGKKITILNPLTKEVSEVK